MADVLSQSEIDALLSALSSGNVEPEVIKPKEEEKHKIKNYDFKSPQKFSKEHIRSLEKVHDNFARIISNYLTGQLRRSVKVNIESVEQVTYEEFIRSIPNPTVISYFKMSPLQGSILLELNPEFTFQILEILLGGIGNRGSIVKELTDIEKNIITMILSDMIKNLKLAWAEVLDVQPEFEGLETNASANQTLAPNEPIALLSFSIEMGKTNTYINLCIPYLSIEKVLDKLVVQYSFQGSKEDDNGYLRDIINKSLNPVEVNVRAELGSTEIKVEEFLELVVDDIIKLDSRISDPVKLFVEDELCYIGKPGIIGKALGIELLDTISKDVNEDE